jgi:hypothetical protein
VLINVVFILCAKWLLTLNEKRFITNDPTKELVLLLLQFIKEEL